MSDRTRHHVHVVAGTCLRAAVRAGKLARNPIAEALKPRVEEKAEGDENAIGIALGRDNLARLSAAFADHPLSLLVATAISTGARRNEILALRWSDFDATAQTLRIVRALEEAKQDKGKRIRRVKPPKTREGKRTVTIDPGLTSRLSAERDRVLRIMAGVPKNATVDLSLIKLPENALIFPSFDRGLCEMRDANAVTRTFERTARKVLGLPRLRLHDLRHTHGSRLIAAGVPITAVAARMGHKPEVLLRCYAHEIKAAEERRASAEIIAALAVG